MFLAILLCKNTLYKYGDKIKGNKKMVYFMGCYPNFNYGYTPFSNMGYSPYMSNYRYSMFGNYSPYMSNCRCNNSFFGNSNMNNPYYEQGYISGRKQRILNIANQSSYTLYETQTTLQESIASDELTRTQKRTLSKYLKKVSNLQQQFQNLVSQSQTASALQAVDTINNQIEALQYVMNMLLAEIQEELAEYNAEVEAEDDDEVVDDSDETVDDDEVVGDSDDSDAATTPSDETPADDVTSEEYTAEDVATIITENGGEDQPFTLINDVSQEVLNINEAIYDAVDGCGTKNDQLNDAIEKITKDNVLDVFDNWNASYGADYKSDDPLGLIETICDEEMFFNNRLYTNSNSKKRINHILNALMTKAEELAKIHGKQVMQLVQPHKAKANAEINAYWYTDEDKLAKEINTIVSILTIYEHKKQS